MKKYIAALSSLCSVIVLSALMCAYAQARDKDEPDLAREAKFHQIYKNFNENPTPEQSWQSALGTAQAQTYTVQQGDTLWSLSDTLFGDSEFWPKVWSINNGKITNPHMILPSQVVQFVPGTLGEAPSVNVTDGAAQTAEQAIATPEELRKFLKKAPIPASSVKTHPLSGLPDSLPKWKFKEDERQVIHLEITPSYKNFSTPEQNLVYYATEQDIEGLGEITETELLMSSAAEFQYIFVKLSSKSASGKYLVVKTVDKVNDPYSRKKGNLVEVQGEIQITNIVNSDENIYRAMVLKTLSSVEVGSKIIAGELPTYNAKDDGNLSSANVRVVGGAFSGERKILGPDNIIIFNGGTAQGISSGQTLQIYKQQQIRNEKSKAVENSRPIGKAKVVKVSAGFATAVVLSATDDIQIGDSTAVNIVR